MSEEQESKLLSRSDIFGIANDIQTERVEVPEWGGAVLVRGLTGAERDAFEASVVGERKKDSKFNYQNFRSRLAVMSIVDEDGKRAFSQADVQRLGERSALALQRIFNVAQRLSGIDEGDVEEMTGNSSSGETSAAFTSD